MNKKGETPLVHRPLSCPAMLLNLFLILPIRNQLPSSVAATTEAPNEKSCNNRQHRWIVITQAVIIGAKTSSSTRKKKPLYSKTYEESQSMCELEKNVILVSSFSWMFPLCHLGVHTSFLYLLSLTVRCFLKLQLQMFLLRTRTSARL